MYINKFNKYGLPYNEESEKEGNKKNGYYQM